MASLSFSPNNSSQQRMTLAHIDAVVSMRLGPTRGLGKSQPACFNRQVAMYLASHVGRWSTTVIGRSYEAAITRPWCIRSSVSRPCARRTRTWMFCCATSNREFASLMKAVRNRRSVG